MRGGWSGFGMVTVGIHPTDFELNPTKIPPGGVVKNCRNYKCTPCTFWPRVIADLWFSRNSILSIIHRYRLDHLKNMCEEELVKRVEASNAADILRSHDQYKKYLNIKFWRYWKIRKSHASDILRSFDLYLENSCFFLVKFWTVNSIFFILTALPTSTMRGPSSPLRWP